MAPCIISITDEARGDHFILRSVNDISDIEDNRIVFVGGSAFYLRSRSLMNMDGSVTVHEAGGPGYIDENGLEAFAQIATIVRITLPETGMRLVHNAFSAGAEAAAPSMTSKYFIVIDSSTAQGLIIGDNVRRRN